MDFELENQRLLITGASGTLGSQLLYECQRRGIRPIAHIRPTSDTAYIDSLGLEKRTADLRSEKALTQMVEGVDAVIHTAGLVSFRQDRLTQFTGVNTFGALNLFQASQKAGVKRFVHISTTGAIGALPKDAANWKAVTADLIDESTEFNLGHLRIPYLMTKRAAEVELRQASRDGKTELVIVNPSTIIAPDRPAQDRRLLGNVVNRFILPAIPARVNLVDIRDVAAGVMAALEKGRAGERYILGGENILLRDLFLEMSSIVERTPRVLYFPRWFYGFVGRSIELFHRLTGRAAISVYADLVKLIDYEWAYSSAKAQRELGYTFRPLRETLQDYFQNTFAK